MNGPEGGVPPLSRRKLVAFSLILAALVFGVLEGAAQVYLRMAQGYTGDSFLQYQFDPYKNIVPVPNWVDSRGVRHNAQGFRRSENVTRDKPPGTFRVFLMGASTAYGTGGLWPHLQRDYAVLDNSETIDAYLEEMIAQALPGHTVEVINAAIPSAQTHHELVYLNQTILNYQPDLVLFLDGLNDHFYYNRGRDQFFDYAYTEQSHVIMGPPTLGSLIAMNGWWLFRKSAFANVAIRAGQGLKAVIEGPEEPMPIVVEEAITTLPDVFRRNALSMIRRNAVLLQNEGVPAVFMLQPMLALERERLARMPEIERTMFEFNLEVRGENYEAYIRRATPVVARMIEETVTPLGASFVDLTGIYAQAEGQVFTDYAHLTPPANRLVAEHVLAELERRDLLPRAPDAAEATPGHTP